MLKTAQGVIALIIFYLLGAWTQNTLQLPIPGSVFGMCYLFIYLVCLRKTPKQIEAGSKFLIDNLTLWLIPGCVGVMTCLPLITEDAFAIVLTLATGIPLSIVLSALLLQRFMRAACRKRQSHAVTE